jgi:Carboxypeptidase regulatory-like domain
MRAALVSLLAIAAATAQDQAGRIEGVVVDSVSHQPVQKASVSIFPIGVAPNQSQHQGPQTVITDAGGSFGFNNVATGSYQLTVTHRNYPARRGGVRKTVQVTATENAPTVSVELIPGASLSGHVVDEDGDPLSGCMVQIHSAKNFSQSEGGRFMRMPMAREDGSYRLYGLTPGKYTITAQCTAMVFEPRPLSEGPDPPPSAAYPIQFYPGSSDLKSAQVVKLLPGAEKSGIDFQMRPVAVTHIHGKLVAGSADWRGRHDLQIQLEPFDPHGARGFTSGAEINSNDGSFELRQVFPGSYRLVAFSRDVFSPQGHQDDANNRMGGTMQVNVADRSIEVSLQLHRSMDLTGTVEIERGNDATTQITPNQIQIILTSDNQFGGSPPTSQVNDDGSFTLKSVLPGEWRVRMQAPSGFVKSVRFGNDDVTKRPLDLTSGVAAPLHIIVGTNTATISGTAPPGQVVFSSRIGDDEEAFLGFRGVPVSDSNGQFKLQGLAPGTYRITAGDIGDLPPDEGGQEVTVAEGETRTIEVKPESKP